MAGAGAAALAAIPGIVSSLGGLFSNQSRPGAGGTASPGATIAPRQDTSTQAIALAPDKKARRAAQRNAREERMVALITDPQVMGVLVTLGGMLAASHMPFSEDKVTNARLRGVAVSACVLMGLGRANVGDLTSLAVAVGAGAATAAGESGALMPNIPGTDVPAWVALAPGVGLPYMLTRALDQS